MMKTTSTDSISSNLDATHINKRNKHTKLSKYTKLIFGIGIFIFLMIGVLIANIMISASIKELSSGINLAGRQRMLSQRTAKLVNMVDLAHQNKDAVALKEAQEELELTYRLFDQTLTAFAEGGETIGADGKTAVALSQIKSQKLRPHVDDALDIWSGFGPNVAALTNSKMEQITADQMRLVRGQAAQYNLQLLRLMNNLTQGLEVEASKKASSLQAVQGTVLVLVLANFGWIVVSALGTLRKSDKQLEEYSKTLEGNNANLAEINNRLASTQQDLEVSNGGLQSAYSSLQDYSREADARTKQLEELSRNLNRMKEESDTIFNSVDHGLCLIDEKFLIGKRVSAAMYDIFETEMLSERSLVDLLRPLITEKDVRTLEGYLKLQFNSKTSEKQLLKYNPVKNIEVTLNWDGKGFTSKHLGFEFERIMDDEKIVAVLVTVTDVTETVALESQLKQANQDQERKTALILDIIQTDSNELKIFLAQTDQALDDINDTLRDEMSGDDADDAGEKNKDLIEAIYRKVHNIKGNASMLKLQSIVSTANQVEEKLAVLRTKKVITGDEFLGSVVELAYMREQLNDYDELTHTLLKEFSGGAPIEVKKALTKSEVFENSLEDFTQKLGSELNKEVTLRAKFDLDHLTDEMLSMNKDLFIQLIRNSMVHGIESVEERRKAGKWEAGSLFASYRLDESKDNALGCACHSFSYRDDGAGLDVEKLKKELLEKGMVTKNAAKKMTEREVISHIFKPGFSTASESSEHAGRGVGMGIIRDHIVNKLGGKMRIRYKKGQYLEFGWIVPARQEETQDEQGDKGLELEGV